MTTKRTFTDEVESARLTWRDARRKGYDGATSRADQGRIDATIARLEARYVQMDADNVADAKEWALAMFGSR